MPGFALPIPSLVIRELLGVPYAHHERFQRDSATPLDLGSSAEAMMRAFDDLTAFLGELVETKRAVPAEGVRARPNAAIYGLDALPVTW